MTSVIIATSLGKHYAQGASSIRALDGVDLTVRRGEFVSIMGPRGSGKSTLLHILGGLERPTAGSLRVADIDICGLSDNELARFRRRNIGFIFQFFNLIPALTVAENVALPLLLDGARYACLRDRVEPLLEMFSLGDRAGCMPCELLAHEIQRVAIARALVMSPDLILADEPTARLDSRSGGEVLAYLRRVREDRGVTIILVTHDLGAASCADRVVILRDGHIESDAPIRRLSRRL
ncbi:MAG TPA: ABC transporter ATP-binding protein [Deltaproteobacteria bacterium]|jgi:putative ABC transport system ATP-binding protein|nr:ABC transporter ATP-binding protein [Deltaproteobacteria bacterium]